MIFISMKMIRNAVGMVISSTIVTATTNRTIGRLATRMSTMAPPKMAMRATNATVVATKTGMTVNTTLPGKVRRLPALGDDRHAAFPKWVLPCASAGASRRRRR